MHSLSSEYNFIRQNQFCMPNKNNNINCWFLYTVEGVGSQLRHPICEVGQAALSYFKSSYGCKKQIIGNTWNFHKPRDTSLNGWEKTVKDRAEIKYLLAIPF